MMFWGKRANTDAVSLFYRQLAVMLASGMPFLEAFNTLSEDCDYPKIKQMITAVTEDISKGISLAEALSNHPKFFNEALVNILKKDVHGKKVSKVLYRTADEIDKTNMMKRKILQAILFPSVTFVLALIVIMVILIFVIPVFVDMFTDLGSQLPYLTRLVMSISHMVVQNLIYLMIGFAVIIILLISSKKILYSFASLIPLVRGVLQKISILAFTRSLSTLLSFELPFKEAVRYSASTIHNVLFAEKIKRIAEKISDVSQLKEELRATGIVPNMVLQIISVGEKSESLEYVLTQVSDYYEKDVDKSFYRLINVIEVLIILFVGFFVGTIVIAMYLPIFSMAGAVAG
jgi:type IV pilus assembly protein PilC